MSEHGCELRFRALFYGLLRIRRKGRKTMARVLIIGCGGVATVGIVKCTQHPEVFEEICIASRTLSKCDALKERLQPTTKSKITTCKIDAGNLEEVVALMKSYKPDMLIHMGMPYHNLVLMEACVRCKVHYLDTAAYEPEDVNEPEFRKYYDNRCKEKGF